MDAVAQIAPTAERRMIMTDNEIIKALRECTNNGYNSEDGTCRRCPLQDFSPAPEECMTELLRNALNLINRQKAEIKALRMDNQQLQSDIINANMNADHALAEIERLTAERDVMHQDVIAAEEYAWQCKTAKAEAYKEFAERVKLEFYYEFDELIPSIMADKIDNLAKEMAGDN